MDTEIELKLLLDSDIKDTLESSYLPAVNAEVKTRQLPLFNQYFDTKDRQLSKHQIGFRIRGHNGQFEQTVKTAGRIVGGLHSRPEYNVPLESNQPDLSLFDSSIWPEGLNVAQVQDDLMSVFSTDFVRHEYSLTFEDGSSVELVMDQGKIKAQGQQTEINEIELELRQGDPLRLFDLAESLLEHVPMRVGTLSKAARGYMLAEDRAVVARPLDHFLEVNQIDTVESGFIKVVEVALSHWQYHENTFIQSGKVNQLRGMLQGMQLMLQAMTVYLPLLQCEAMLNLHKRLLDQLNKWHWLEQSFSLKELRSQKGQYRKMLAKNDDLMSFLRGISEGLLAKYQPLAIIYSTENCKLQLVISRMLIEKPWLKESKGSESKLTEHAKAWLSQGWLTIMQVMPKNQKVTEQDYLFQQSLLRQTLFNGFMLGKLFSEQRDQFRAPWLDLLEGIDDLKTLVYLKRKLDESDLGDKQDLLKWADEKIKNLLAVMEQSRRVAVNVEAYW